MLKYNPDIETVEVNAHETITINGLDMHPRKVIESLGTAKIDFLFMPSLKYNVGFTHKFHIVRGNEANLDYDGILGNDFFQMHGFVIDYQRELALNEYQSTYIYFKDPKGRVYLTPRSECLVKVNVNDTHKLGQGVIEKFQMARMASMLAIALLLSMTKDNPC